MKDRFPSALCRQTQRDLWFPDEGVSDCLNFALSMSDNPAGIWGATTRRQRSELRR